MATKTLYLLNTTAASPDWGGRIQDGGSAPTGANSAFGGTVAKNSPPRFFVGFVGATGVSTQAFTSTNLGTSSWPRVGTGSGASASSNFFRSQNPMSGAFAAGNWTFNFTMRATTATAAGQFNFRVWATTDPAVGGNSTVTRQLNGSPPTPGSLLTSSIISLAATGTTYTSTYTWAAPAITLNNEYLVI